MIHHGKTIVTSAGTAVPLTSTRTMASFVTIYPRIVGNATNAGEVRIGGNPTSASNGGTGTTPKNIPQGSGMPLSPGSAGVLWPMQAVTPVDLNTVYVDADNSGDGVQWIYGVP